MDPKSILLAVMVVLACVYYAFWTLSGLPGTERRRVERTMGISFVANFFDTLGIGSYATTTSMLRFWKLIADEKIPGTLNVGYVLATVLQSLIYISIIEVEFTTLIAIIGAAVAGAWIGGGVVSRWPRRKVQIGMGFALVGAACLMLASLTGIGPAPGTALGVSGGKLALAMGISGVLGSLMMLGIGYYAPCLIMISLLGMNPTAAFPIMMGACAFLMPVGSIQFIRRQAYDLHVAIALCIGSPLAVLVAAFIVKSLPLDAVRWLVVVVVLYTAAAMLRTAALERAVSVATSTSPSVG
jgi:uncharacterized membrane protein YfcA